MKQRNGFVSNSSSSSFILYGVSAGRDVIDKYAAVAYEHLGEEKAAAAGYESVDALAAELDDYPCWVSEKLNLPVEILHYDEYFFGVNLCFSRESLVTGVFTREELDAIDAFIAKLSTSAPNIHEGEYYC